MDKIEETLIVGAGLTGLHLAKTLATSGRSSLLIEKSRGLGGRVATRRLGDLGLDHGALYLSHQEFFRGGPLPLNHADGFYLEGGMNLLPKSLAQGLSIERNQRAKLITSEGGFWVTETEEGQRHRSLNLVLTAPLPQALELLEENGFRFSEHGQLKSCAYSKALILLAVLGSVPETASSQVFEGHRLSLMRERSLHPRGIVMHLSETFSEEFFDLPEEALLETLQALFKRSPLGHQDIQESSLKKWRYSRPRVILEEPFVEVAPGLLVTGDAFNGALRSANKLVQVLRTLA